MRVNNLFVIAFALCSLVPSEAKKVAKEMPNIKQMFSDFGKDGKLPDMNEIMKSLGGEKGKIPDLSKMLDNLGGGKGKMSDHLSKVLDGLGGDKGKMSDHLSKVLDGLGEDGKAPDLSKMMNGEIGSMIKNMGEHVPCEEQDETCAGFKIQNIEADTKVHGCHISDLMPKFPGLEDIAVAEQHHEDLDQCCVLQQVCQQVCGMSSADCHQKWKSCVEKACTDSSTCEMEATMLGQMMHQHDHHDDSEMSVDQKVKAAKCKMHNDKQSGSCQCVKQGLNSEEEEVQNVADEAWLRYSGPQTGIKKFDGKKEDLKWWMLDLMFADAKSDKGMIDREIPEHMVRFKKMFGEL